MDTSLQADSDDAVESVGHSVPILVPGKDGRLVLDEPALRSVLLQDGVRNLPVVVVAVAGAFRRGKSFLLSLLLRFLERGGAANWQGAPNEPLTGFAWQNGFERHTVGIHMWSQPARLHLPSGDEVAVVLMDTQGTFDTSTVASENATLFALSALISSVQIYNVSQGLGTDALQHLQLYAEYGNVAADAGLGTVFQRLLFLVRDWQFPSGLPYGSKGGQILLRKTLDSPSGTPEELHSMREHLKNCFSDIDCFLLPHPGKQVATSSTFNGCPEQIDDEFLEGIDELAQLLFSPNSLQMKESAGQVLTAGALVNYFTTICKELSSGKMPKPGSLVETMSEANHLASVSRGCQLYEEKMRSMLDNEPDGVPEDQLRRKHEAVKQEVDSDYDKQKKMLGKQGTNYKKEMMTKIESSWQQILDLNKNKNELADMQVKMCCNQVEMELRDEHRLALHDLLSREKTTVDTSQLLDVNVNSCETVLRKFDERTAKCSRKGLVAEYRDNLQKQVQTIFEDTKFFNEQRRNNVAGAEEDRIAMLEAIKEHKRQLEDIAKEKLKDENELKDRLRVAEEFAKCMFMANRGQGHSGKQEVDKIFDRQIQQESESNVVIKSVNSVVDTLASGLKGATKLLFGWM